MVFKAPHRGNAQSVDVAGHGQLGAVTIEIGEALRAGGHDGNVARMARDWVGIGCEQGLALVRQRLRLPPRRFARSR